MCVMFSAKLCLYFEVCKGLEIRGVGGRPSDWGRNNNLGLSTYRDEAMSGKSDFHVDISKYPGGEFLFPR